MTADPTPDPAALIEEMTAKAEKATPHPWTVEVYEKSATAFVRGRIAYKGNCRPSDGTGPVAKIEAALEPDAVMFSPMDEEALANAAHIAASCPANVLALVAAFKAMTERAQTAERERDEARGLAVRGVCHDAVGDEWGHFPCPHKSEAEALVAELTEILGPVLGTVRRADMLGDDDDDLRGIRLGILRRAARLLSPPKDAPGETTGAL